MSTWMIVGTIFALLAVAIAVGIVAGRLLDGSRSSRDAVAAAHEAAPPRLREVVEQLGNLEADMKNMQRQWGDFEKSWERRWGTLTRQARRDSAAAAEQQDPGDSTDDAQLNFAPAPQASAQGGERRRLVPTRMLGIR